MGHHAIGFLRANLGFHLNKSDGDTYILDIDPKYHTPFASQGSAPDLRSATIHRLADYRMLEIGSISAWMEFTRTRLWLLWDQRSLFQLAKKRDAELQKLTNSRDGQIVKLSDPSLLFKFDAKCE